MEYLDKTGLTTLWGKIKDKISTDAVLTHGANITGLFTLKNTDSNKTFEILTTANTQGSGYSSSIRTNMSIKSTESIQASKFTLADTELAINTNFLMANGEVLAKDALATDILTKSNVTATLWGSGVSDSSSVQDWIQLLMDQVYPRGTIDSKFEEITSRITSVLSWKGTKADLSAITQITQANKGDVWHSNADGKEYVATDAITGTANPSVWEELGSTQDLSLFYKAIDRTKINNQVSSDRRTLLTWYGLDNTPGELIYPVASAERTGMIRLYDRAYDSLTTSIYSPVQLTENNVAYVDIRGTLTEDETTNTICFVPFIPTTVGGKIELKGSDYYYYIPSKKTLYVNNIRQSNDVSDTLPPSLGTKSIGSTTQLIYLNNGVITAGEALTAITDSYINSLE